MLLSYGDEEFMLLKYSGMFALVIKTERSQFSYDVLHHPKLSLGGLCNALHAFN